MSLTGWKLARQRYRVNDSNNNNETVLQSFGKDREFALIPK